MIRNRPLPALAVAAVLLLSACGGTSADQGGATGEPVAGGTARVIQINEPRSLDPAIMGNAWAFNAVLGNAIYGTLMVNDPKTGKIEYKLAESMVTEDGGASFELTLREGLTFSDGSPFNAEAVKFNWDRIKDPATGSAASNIQEASLAKTTEVVDARTLKITMVEPIPNYAQALVSSSLNWIASPTALRAGQRAFDAKPVGAGPFTVESWTRQDSIELVKNPKYWDAPKPYLDRITLRSINDSTQRINTLTSGGADVAVDTNWATMATARDAGFAVDTMPLNGGQYLAMNARRAPFDDVRARQAVAAALDLRAMDTTVYNGKGSLVPTLFTESSPFHSGQQLVRTDKAAAQRLFDELAAEGNPVSFTFKSYPSPESKAVAESVQAQLSTFRNVEVRVEIVDHTEVASLHASHDFDMLISSAFFIDPEPRLWTVFHGDSRGNVTGIDDEQLNAALQQGRESTSEQERKAAYERVQQRLAEIVPGIFYTRSAASAVSADNVGGVVQYGYGSLLPEELWIQP
ncbi:ABC transporter substrate-binding protein [Prauserella sp. PE36]|uniref:ABC transporter substrate-binding protein n=1 Tax=Prauserella sp. PE36 TaxID=1504709 RepID=UPI000DE200CC|nr:ABC transporter substrate-binding protein [Prauserella sp. PE36]RBM16202.1 ABC transporter substrate-binding protein [Prauserella sp. PE36]